MSAIPTTKQLFEEALTALEAAINQKSPLTDKAFLRVLAQVLAGQRTGLYKNSIQLTKENLILSASIDGLTDIGNNFKIYRKEAVPAEITATLAALTGTLISQTIDFSGVSNGVRYRLDSDTTAVADVATLLLTAQTAGAAGNLNPGDSLSIGTQVPGAGTIATVVSLDVTGANQETVESFRQRILDKARSRGGGGNLFDYRNWSQEVAGVDKAYPYSGRPITDPTPSKPIERTVFVESTKAINIDGIPPQSLLDQVRAQILIDPVTGRSRPPLGLTDETLFVEPITRTPLFVEVRDLQVDTSIETQVKADIDSAVSIYFLNLSPFIDGLDPAFEKNDVVTDLSVSLVIQDVLAANGAAASGISFGFVPGVPEAELVLGQGEHAKLGGAINYV